MSRERYPASKLYYGPGGKAWLLERVWFYGKVAKERWVRIKEYDRKH